MKNIVLIGMMGCGKTTVGRLAAEKLGMAFVDTDEKELARQSGLVIACGGGLPTRPDSIAALKGSGVVFWINRDPGEIYDTVSMAGRPLGQGGRAAFLERFARREGIYRQWADHIIQGHRTAREAASRLCAIYQEGEQP